MYYSVIYEENQKGYLLNTSYSKIESLGLMKLILEDFSKNDYIFSGKAFMIEDKFQFIQGYKILSHKKQILLTKSCKVLFVIELENSFLYQIQTSSGFFDLECLIRNQDDTLQYISKNLDKEIDIGLN